MDGNVGMVRAETGFIDGQRTAHQRFALACFFHFVPPLEKLRLNKPGLDLAVAGEWSDARKGFLNLSDSRLCLLVPRAFRNLYRALRGYSAQMPIAFISVKPSPARIRYIDNILRFNQMVQAFLQNQPATKYIDIYTAMLGPDQKPNPALFVQDQIHLSGLGYQLLRWDVSTFLSSELHPSTPTTKTQPAVPHILGVKRGSSENF